MTVTTREELDELYNSMRVDAINEGLAEDTTEEDMQPLMNEHFGGVPYKMVRELVKDNYPEKFI